MPRRIGKGAAVAGIAASPAPRPGLRPTAVVRLPVRRSAACDSQHLRFLTARNTARTPLPGGRRLAPDSAGSRRLGMPVTSASQSPATVGAREPPFWSAGRLSLSGFSGTQIWVSGVGSLAYDLLGFLAGPGL